MRFPPLFDEALERYLLMVAGQIIGSASEADQAKLIKLISNLSTTFGDSPATAVLPQPAGPAGLPATSARPSRYRRKRMVAFYQLQLDALLVQIKSLTMLIARVESNTGEPDFMTPADLYWLKGWCDKRKAKLRVKLYTELCREDLPY